MKELNYTNLLPDTASVAVLGESIEEPLIRALAYRKAEGSNVIFVPITPKQLELANALGLDIGKGYADYFYLEADFELREGLFTVGHCTSPLLMRLYEMGAEKVIVFLRRKYHTVSVEYVTFLSDRLEPIISLYGEIVARRESPHGSTVVDIVPLEEDPEELRRILKELPGVVEVGIVPVIPYRKVIMTV